MLIDGDITLVCIFRRTRASSFTDGLSNQFDNEYVRRGSSGGRDAARKLYFEVEQYLKKLAGHQDHWEIIIKVYSNLSGLGKAYADAQVIDPVGFRDFVRRFNKEYAHCEYIDAGDDKEAADKKVQSQYPFVFGAFCNTKKIETMDLFYHNSHCKQICLGVSGDNSYTGFLRPVMPTSGKSQRITLIEALPFAAGLEEISNGFQCARFEGLFRNTRLITRRVSFKDDRTITPPKTPISTYAATVSRTSEVPLTSPANETPRVSSTLPSEIRANGHLALSIHRNRLGQRIDPIVGYDKGLVRALKVKKYCNRHFLSTCGYGYANCSHTHEGNLTSAELETLRYVARLSPCATIWCNDSACVAGHRCPYCAPGQACAKGNACRFPAEMHNVDTKIVDVVKV